MPNGVAFLICQARISPQHSTDPPGASTETQPEPLSAERIEELIDWTLEQWQSNDELRETVSESELQDIVDSLKGEL